LNKHSNISDGKEVMEYPLAVELAGINAKRHYKKMIDDGQSPMFAEMCATRTPPGTKGTDRTLMEGRLNNEQFDKMPKDQAQKMIKAAKEAGVNPNGKYYASGLADKRGVHDPKAWIDSASDITKVAQERNLTVKGAVNHQGRKMPRPKSPVLSERLTKEMMQVEKPSHPTMKQGELREMVQEKYGRKRRN
jgi:hypothetical protein